MFVITGTVLVAVYLVILYNNLFSLIDEVIQRHSEFSPVNMIIKTRDRRRPYILSSVPRNRLIKRYHRYSIGLMILFFTAVSFAAWIITLRIHGG